MKIKLNENQPVLLVVIFCMLCISGFSYYGFINEKRALYSSADQQVKHTVVPSEHVQEQLNEYLYKLLMENVLFLFFAYLIYRVSTHNANRKLMIFKKKYQREKSALSLSEEYLGHALKTANQSLFDLNIRTGKILISGDYPTPSEHNLSELQLNMEEWQQKIHSDDRDTAIRLFQESLSTGKDCEIEYRKKTRNGNWVWLHYFGAFVQWDNENNPLRMIGVHTNITERKRTEQVLRALAETASIKSSDIFRTIVRQLALSHDMHCALIACINPDDNSKVDTLAVWAGNDFINNMSFSPKGTPCQDVIHGNTCFYPDNIQQIFPDDCILTEMGVESYLGVPLRNRQKEILGILCVFDNRPMNKQPKTVALLNSLATRASIELERRSSEAKLKLSSRVFTGAHEGITITDANGFIIDVNPAFCEITGYSRDELIGQNHNILNSGKQTPAFYDEMWQTIVEQGYWQGEIWNRKKNGELYAEKLTISSLKDDEGNTQRYVGMFFDITSNKEQQNKLEMMAHYDVLTRLPNRTLFADRFERAIAHSKRTDTLLAVCFLDLDNFKPVNDNYGHEVGDHILVQVAERIVANIREEDTVSRQGGDEFAILLGDIESFDHCKKILERILLSLARPYIVDGRSHDISASIGVTLYPQDDADLDTLIRHADNAMYQAKLEGRNRYFLFDVEGDQYITHKHIQQQEIFCALENQEFCLYYQPKVNMVTGEVFGVEALIRWIHPDRGIINPMGFLPLIDGTVLEISIGEWVINEALKQLDSWKIQGIELEISINISSYHLQSYTFFAELEAALARFPNVEPNNLQLEILESSALGDLSYIRNIIKRCHDELDVHISLDDFGTGHSSLTHLRNLPVSTIKIDQSFVRDMLDDPGDYAIIDGVIGLAKSFNRCVIAEGVETTQHGLVLILMGCEEAQGYGISRPMPVADMPNWLDSYKPNQAWINSAKEKRTIKEKSLSLLKITLEYWFGNFETQIKSPQYIDNESPGGNRVGPYQTSWIILARQTNLFDEEWLVEFEKTHNEMALLANDLINEYNDGKVDTANNRIEELRNAFEKISIALGSVDLSYFNTAEVLFIANEAEKAQFSYSK